MNFAKEISRAEKLLDEMAVAEHLDDYTSAWEEFLYRLERAWERTEKAFNHEKWFQKLYAPYRKLRKGDPVLKYLRNARHAETHTLQGTLQSSLNIALRDKCGRGFHVNEVQTSLVDGCLTVNIDTHPDVLHDFDAEIGRGTPSLVAFRNRKNWYKPPKTHLGARLSSNDPVVVGKLGLDMYRCLTNEIENQSHNKSFQLTGKSVGGETEPYVG